MSSYKWPTSSVSKGIGFPFTGAQNERPPRRSVRRCEERDRGTVRRREGLPGRRRVINQYRGSSKARVDALLHGTAENYKRPSSRFTSIRQCRSRGSLQSCAIFLPRAGNNPPVMSRHQYSRGIPFFSARSSRSSFRSLRSHKFRYQRAEMCAPRFGESTPPSTEKRRGERYVEERVASFLRRSQRSPGAFQASLRLLPSPTPPPGEFHATRCTCGQRGASRDAPLTSALCSHDEQTSHAASRCGPPSSRRR